ncbi:MAG TPA: methionine--tRNA ligase [Candidatus Omnitrophota bacterium]|nr:methionine--tRNA ligase [Candidatus Omnitrophota bacterium]HPS37535.1 methionine--tRNA ligase [Candidatus Omnitrophota bacterium]
MTKTYYLTTPIYYVNGKPHIGHAYTSILCDTFSRFRRMLGDEVFYLTGTDEHGIKVQKAAAEQGKSPKDFVDEIVPKFKELWQILGIKYDHFVRTTDGYHKKVVQAVLSDLEKKGDIYKASYKGWYCTPCESFWTELQLKEGKCPDCGRAVERLEEENYFFKMSTYQTWLIEYIQKNPEFIRPEIRRNEVLGFLKEPLEDLCITRPKARLTWGIEYPGSPDHVVYVWFDALLNYISAASYLEDEKKFKSLWPADLQLLGKDILRQHAVFWPIMLKASGIEMPKLVFAHGWWRIGGAKMSKSLGNIVDPIEIVAKYGSDVLRYFLLREVTLGLDGTYSEDLLIERYSSDLANDLGNLWHRTASMIEKYFEGKVPEGDARKRFYDPAGLWKDVSAAVLGYDPREALAKIWAVIVRANQFVEENKPWALAKDSAKKQDLADVLFNLADSVAHVGILLQAFMPDTAKKILGRLKVAAPGKVCNDAEFGKPLAISGTVIEKGEPLFPRLDEKTS